MKFTPVSPLQTVDCTNAFRTHTNYVEAFYHLLDRRWETGATVTLPIHVYSLIDYFYRLRIKSNYEDADMFTDGPTDSKQSEVFYRRLCAMASATLFLSELSVMPIWGKSKFLAHRENWMKPRSQKVTQQELLDRSSLLSQHPI